MAKLKSALKYILVFEMKNKHNLPKVESRFTKKENKNKGNVEINALWEVTRGNIITNVEIMRFIFFLFLSTVVFQFLPREKIYT